jgi:hypothetical protein
MDLKRGIDKATIVADLSKQAPLWWKILKIKQIHFNLCQ